MGKDTATKITTQEIYDILSALVANKAHHQMVLDMSFGDRRLPEKFHTHSPEPGKFMVLQEFEGQVCKYVAVDSVASALCSFTREMPDAYKHFKLTGNQMRDAVDYWILSQPVLTEEIAPVLWKSTPGKTFRRLDFDMKDEPTPLFDDFLAHMETNREAFLAFCGSLFDSKAQRQFYVWMQGQGNDGKGVWSRFLSKIFGEAYAGLSDDERMHNQFFTSQCIGKRVGVFSDCENRDFVRRGLFLSLTGDDVVSCQYKGKDAVSMQLPTMFFFLSNKLPNITGLRAHIRRAIICKMLERSEEEMKDCSTYEARFWEERAGIVTKCYAAWKRMQKEHGGLVIEKEVSLQIASDNDGSFEFLFDQFFVAKKNAVLVKNAVFRILTEEKKQTVREVGDFYEWMQRERGVCSQFTKPKDGPRVRNFVGLALKAEWSHYGERVEGTPDASGRQF